LLSRLFLSPNSTAWTLFLELSAGNDPAVWLPSLEALRADFPDVRFAGPAYVEGVVKQRLLREFFPLLLLCAALLLGVYGVLLRSLVPALLLWSASLLPALVACSLFPLFRQPLRAYTVLAPFLTLALSTSYSMHLFYGFRSAGGDARHAVGSRGPIVLLDGLAAVLGFATLLFSPVRELRTLGAFVMGGLAVSLFTAFVPFLSMLQIMGPRLAARKGLPFAGPHAEPRRVLKIGRAVAASVLALSVVGATRISIGYRERDQFPPWSREHREMRWMQEQYGSSDELVLVADSGRELGLADPSFFSAMADFTSGAARAPGVSGVLSYVDLVTEVEARLAGVPTGPGTSPPPAPAETAIAEDLEMARSLSGGSLVSLFADPAMRRARVSISVRQIGSRADVLAVQDVLQAELRRAGLAGGSRWGGLSLTRALLDRGFAREQTVSLAVLLAAYALLLSLVFGSARRGAVALAAPVCGVAAALGLTGALGWRLNQMNILSIVAVASLSVDGAIMCLMIEPNPATRRAIRDAALLIMAAMAALAFSSFYLVLQTVAACIWGLGFATAVVLLVLDPSRAAVRGSALTGRSR
jgi:predicted RND superfamily exporter protein